MDPIAASIGKGSISASVKPTLSFFRSQIARRGSSYADLSTLGTADKEMGEALSVLQGDAEKLPQAIWIKLKGLFSDRPVSFTSENAVHFVSDDRIIDLVKSATRKTFFNEDIAEECSAARAIYASLYDEEEAPFGERLLEDAVAFVVATLAAYLTPSDRILLDFLTEQHNEVMKKLGVLDDLKAAFDSLACPSSDNLRHMAF